MKKLIAIILAGVLLVTLVPAAVYAATVKPGVDFNGAHDTLNLIGKDKIMPGSYSNPDRSTMFVPKDTAGMNFTNPLDPNSPVFQGIKITVTQGTDFAVIDGNATDGYGAFQLGPGKYSTYIAVKAKDAQKSGIVNITGWVQAYDTLGTLWYYLNVGSVSVSKNKNNYTDATGLFFVDSTEDKFGIVGSTPMWVFDYLTALGNLTYIDPVTGLPVTQYTNLAYFWQLTNDGAKLIQVRFYKIS